MVCLFLRDVIHDLLVILQKRIERHDATMLTTQAPPNTKNHLSTHVDHLKYSETNTHGLTRALLHRGQAATYYKHLGVQKCITTIEHITNAKDKEAQSNADISHQICCHTTL